MNSDNAYVIAIILSTIASSLFVASVFQKSKTNMLGIQFVETGLNIVKNFLLGGHSGAIVQLFGFIRNFCGYKNISHPLLTGSIAIGQIVAGSYFNNRGLIGILPIIASVSYTLAIHKSKDAQQLRFALIFNLLLWTIYSFIIRDYPGAVVNISMAMFNIFAVYKNR